MSSNVSVVTTHRSGLQVYVSEKWGGTPWVSAVLWSVALQTLSRASGSADTEQRDARSGVNEVPAQLS